MFGGTFDPIHVGHLVAAVNARHAARLDKVLLVVANVPWQKVNERHVTDAAHRLALARCAVADVEGLEVSDIELRRGGDSYTADTLAELAGTDELFLVVGADVAAEMDTWERLGEVMSLATLVVVNRPGVPAVPNRLGWEVIEASMPAMDLSSTDLRERAADGRPLDFLIPGPAIRYIRERSLYSGGR